MNELVLLWSADADIQAAYEYYDAYQSGRGEVFLRHLDAALGRMRTFPESGPFYEKPHRRLLIQQFPYGVFYSVEGNRIIVVGVMDLRQDPEVIRRRLRGS